MKSALLRSLRAQLLLAVIVTLLSGHVSSATAEDFEIGQFGLELESNGSDIIDAWANWGNSATEKGTASPTRAVVADLAVGDVGDHHVEDSRTNLDIVHGDERNAIPQTNTTLSKNPSTGLYQNGEEIIHLIDPANENDKEMKSAVYAGILPNSTGVISPIAIEASAGDLSSTNKRRRKKGRRRTKKQLQTEISIEQAETGVVELDPTLAVGAASPSNQGRSPHISHLAIRSLNDLDLEIELRRVRQQSHQIHFPSRSHAEEKRLRREAHLLGARVEEQALIEASQEGYKRTINQDRVLNQSTNELHLLLQSGSKEISQLPKFNIDCSRKAMQFVSHGGWGNQLGGLMRGLLLANILNRTLLVAPVLGHQALAFGSCQWGLGRLPIKYENGRHENSFVKRGHAMFRRQMTKSAAHLFDLGVLQPIADIVPWGEWHAKCDDGYDDTNQQDIEHHCKDGFRWELPDDIKENHVTGLLSNMPWVTTSKAMQKGFENEHLDTIRKVGARHLA
jgi:hypothetical protein